MSNKKVSLKEVAQAANVSTALVSYVLNGKAEEKRVGEEIAEKIRRIAKEMNYEPNYLARSLRSGKTHTIGLIIADISNPFFATIARIVEDEAKQHGYTVIIGSSDENAEDSWKLINVLLNRHVDGLIIVSSENTEEQVTYLKKNMVPFVLIDRYFPDIATDAVAINNYSASFDACAHLLERGYRNVGLIAYESRLFHMLERIRGYTSAYAAAGLEVREDRIRRVVFADIEAASRKAIDELTSGPDPVDAIIFSTYGLAVAGLKYLNERQINVPGDLGIVSFGQAEVFELYYCPITYVKQPVEELSRTAVTMLLSKVADPALNVRQVIMEARLVAQESSRAKLPR